MNTRKPFSHAQSEAEILAYFGEARLIKYLDGRLELVGGSDADRNAARKWIAFFLSDAGVHNGVSVLGNAARIESPRPALQTRGRVRQ